MRWQDRIGKKMLSRKIVWAVGVLGLAWSILGAFHDVRMEGLQQRDGKIAAEMEQKRLEGVIEGKDQAMENLREQLASRPLQVVMPQIEIPPSQVQIVRVPEQIQRTLSEAQALAFAKAIQSLPTNLKVEVRVNIADLEGHKYAQEFYRILSENSHADQAIRSVIYNVNTPVGLYIVTHSDEDRVSLYRDLIYNALISSGVQAVPSHGEWVLAGELYIVVGTQE